jgi:hypothetical protein
MALALAIMLVVFAALAARIGRPCAPTIPSWR